MGHRVLVRLGYDTVEVDTEAVWYNIRAGKLGVGPMRASVARRFEYDMVSVEADADASA